MIKKMTRSKILMILSIMTGITAREYDEVSATCMLALSGEKALATKLEMNSAKKKTIKFFNNLFETDIHKNDVTVLQFCNKASDILIDGSTGDVRIRRFKSIKDAVIKQLESVDDLEVDDSQELIIKLE